MSWRFLPRGPLPDDDEESPEHAPGSPRGTAVSHLPGLRGPHRLTP
jgi:hypothetical protein